MKSSNTNARTAVSGSTEFPWKWNLSDLESRPKHGHTVFSCFSCGGGSSMGYKLAGFDVVGNCEIDPDMMKVYKQNNHPKHSFLMDIRDFLNLPDEKIPEELFRLDVLDGSPPCSVFSTAGSREAGWNVEKVFREGQAKQRLDDLFLFFIAIAKRLQPKVVIAENVKGIITGNAKGWVNQIVKAFDDAGYTVQIFLFNAARMGVPQKRERVFFIAHRKDLDYPKLSMKFNSKPIPFGDVREPYGKAMDENSMQAKLLKYRIPSDRCIADINARVRRKKNSGFTTPILSDDEPAYTLVAGSSMYRMCDGLLLTDKDIISCQTFPQDYDFMDQSVQYICGMSVPPVMMARISEQVYRQWLKGSDADEDAEAEKYKPTKFKAKDSVYDKDAADFAVSFIECLCHTKGTWAGKPFELIDWQEQIIRDVFGTMKPNGYRQFNTAYIEIPKKQGKSELAAAVALLLCCGDGEERAEVYGCAADRQQASIVFEVAADMVRMCPALNKRVKILASQKRIIFQPTNSFYQVLSAEAYSKHGFNIHGVVFDELHTQPNRKLFDVMTKGSGDARMQPLYFLITTAGTDTNSICYETHQKAKDILEGRKIDPTFYPVIYGADESDDWTDPKVWKKANPSLDITVGIDKVKAACESAKQNPGEENSFRQLRLNQWVKQAVRWMPMEKWDACAFPVDVDELEGRVCYGGLDLSSTTDLTAFALVFPPVDEEDKYIVLPYFWVPEETLDLRVKRDHVPYDVWERKGFLETTEGNVVHYAYIEKFIERLGERFYIREIAYDRWGATQLSQDLEGMGFTVVPFGQGFASMSPPTKELMRLVLEQKIAHGGHPVLRWNMDNIYIRTDPAGNIKADKAKSTEKIDGAIAMIMALDRAIRCGNEKEESVYDTRGLLVF